MRNIFMLLLLLCLYTSVTAKEYMGNIIVGTYAKYAAAENNYKDLQKRLDADKRIHRLKEKHGFRYISRVSDHYSIIAIEPFYDDHVRSAVFAVVKKLFPKAYLNTLPSKTLLAKYEDERIPVGGAETGTGMTASADGPQTSEKLSSGNTALQWAAVALFFGLLFFHLFQHRRQKARIAALEHENTQLKEQNGDLQSINAEHERTMNLREEMLGKMTSKLHKPMKEIVGKSRHVLTSELSEQQSNELKTIKSSGEMMFEIVDDLLDFMKIRSGKLALKNSIFNINHLLDNVVKAVIDRIHRKDVEVVFEIEKGVPAKLIGDPVRLGQILTNLIENAVKFMDQGEVRMFVGRNDEAKEGEEEIVLVFAVTDNGIGIKEEEIDQIFAPFYQSRETDGSGLGLAISKELTGLMNGQLGVRSSYGEGSEFTLTVTLGIAGVNEKRQYRLPDSAYKKREILVIDYHDHAATALKKMLEYFHNNVDIIPGVELKNSVPEMSGYDMVFISEKLFTFPVVKHLHHIEAETRPKIVVVGSMLHKPLRTNAVKQMADKRLMKPLNQQRILELIIEFYGQESATEDGTISVMDEMTELALKAQRQKREITKENFSEFSGAKILAAEDNEINQKVLQGLLKESGIKLSIAGDGKEALQMLKENREYDLILMDANMPVMDGYEATERIKSNPKFSKIPVVALSGSTMPEDIDMMLEHGMDDHMAKPIQISAMYEIFEKYLERSRKTEEVAQEAAVHQRSGKELYVYEDGLKRAGGDPALFAEVLLEFRSLYSHSVSAFEAMMAKQQYALVKQLSLDIKGVAANIGAYRLSKAAETLQTADFSKEDGSTLLERYRSVLVDTLKVLDEQLTERKAVAKV
jgi:two-component system sensor histidine kinase/response regulator